MTVWVSEEGRMWMHDFADKTGLNRTQIILAALALAARHPDETVAIARGRK